MNINVCVNIYMSLYINIDVSIYLSLSIYILWGIL